MIVVIEVDITADEINGLIWLLLFTTMEAEITLIDCKEKI